MNALTTPSSSVSFVHKGIHPPEQNKTNKLCPMIHQLFITHWKLFQISWYTVIAPPTTKFLSEPLPCLSYHRVGRLYKLGWPGHSLICNTLQMTQYLRTGKLSKISKSKLSKWTPPLSWLLTLECPHFIMILLSLYIARNCILVFQIKGVGWFCTVTLLYVAEIMHSVLIKGGALTSRV